MAEPEQQRWSEFRLGENAEDIVIETSEDNLTLAVQLVSQATHRLDIFTRDLDARIYDNAEFEAVVRSLVVNSSRAKVRVLVIDPDRAIKTGHRLLELSRKLTTSIEIRKVHEDYSANPECYLIADERGLMHRKLASRYEAIVNFNNPSEVLELIHHFNEVWEHSSPELDFKRLYI